MANIKVALLVRVSTDQQDYQRQIDDLSKVSHQQNWEIVKIIESKFSATKTRFKDREDIPVIIDLVQNKAIQKILVTGIPRMGRNAREILELYHFLKDEGVSLYIHQFKLDSDSDTPMGQIMIDMFIGIMGSMAQMETAQLSERIKSGQARARRAGKQIGRSKGSQENFLKKMETNEKYKKAVSLLRKQRSIREVEKLVGISKGTVEKIKFFLEK